MKIDKRLVACILVLSSVLHSHFCLALEDDIRLGALLSPQTTRDQSKKSPEEIAFYLAIEWINENGLLPQGKQLKGFVEEVDPNDEYDCIYYADKLISLGIVALIGPLATAPLPLIGPLTSVAHVPQILPLTSWDTSDLDVNEYEYLLRMSPTEKLKAQVLIDIVKHYKWKRVAVMSLRGDQHPEYNQGKNAFRILASENEIEVVFDRFIPPDPGDGKKINPNEEMQALVKSDLRVAIVFCPAWTVKELLFAANEYKLIEEWAWLFSDLGSSDMELTTGLVGAIPTYMRGVIGLRASIGKGTAFSNLKDNFHKKSEELNITTDITAAAGHVYDSVLITAKGIQVTLQQGIKLSSSQIPKGLCHTDNEPRKGGQELYHNIKKTTFQGAMSDLGFEETGEPKCASFDIMNVRTNGSVKLAEWDTTNKLQQINGTRAVWMSGKTKVPFDIPNLLKNKTIQVVAVLAPPFVMRKNPKGSSDNETEEFEGMSIDILEHMRRELGFRYKISLAPDGLFGTKDRLTGKWNGVIREIIDEKAKLSIAPLTINSDGQNVVDFTHPYMTFGIAFIMRVNEVEENYFRFLKPYHTNLWIAICGMVLTMGIFLWNFSILSPFGYYGRYSQHPNKLKVKPKIKATKHNLSFVNSIWSSWLCYLSQGGQHPASLSGKIAVSVFWFAILIMNATYTANLAAYLTVSRMQTPIETVEDLAHQTKIQYGTLMNSQLQKFFLDTDVPRFLVMGQFMEQRKTWMPTIQDGIDRVMNSNFAFIADRPILEHFARKKKYCGKLKVIGGFGTTYGYGFALPLKSPTTNLFNMEIFRLQRDMIIDSLKHKWSTKETCELVDNMGIKSQNAKGGSAFIQRISLNDMLGVFIFMGIGIALGFIFMIMEWIYACIRDVATKQGPKGYFQAFSLRFSRVCTDIFVKKEAEGELMPTEVIRPPAMPKQWTRMTKHLKSQMDEPSNYEIQSYEVSV